MKKKQIKATISATIIGILAPLVTYMPASAVGYYWSGYNEGFDTTMSASGNWFGPVVIDGGELVFGADGNGQIVDNDLIALSVTVISFEGVAPSTSSKSYTVAGNGFTLSGGIDAIMTGAGGDHEVATDITLGADSTFKTTTGNSLAVGGDTTVLDLGTNDLTLQPDGGTITLMGAIKGTGNIIISGTGEGSILMLTPDETDGYDGALTLSEGETSVNDNLGLNVTISGGTLKGTGTVGSVTMSSGAVAPGNSPGVINTGDLTYTGGSFDIELGGTADGEFDQTNVTGAVNLGSATDLNISLFGGFEPAVDDSFIIVANDASDAVDGTFNGLAEGDSITVDGYTYEISYAGGSGNDVVLTVTATPTAPDTGSGSLLRSPLTTLLASLTVAGAVVGIRYSETKKQKSSK